MNFLFLDNAIFIDFTLKVVTSVIILLAYLGTKNKLFLWWFFGWLFLSFHAFFDHLLLYSSTKELWFLRDFVWALSSVFFLGGLCWSKKRQNVCLVNLFLLSLLCFFSAYIGLYLFDSWFISAASSSLINGSLLIISGYYFYKTTIEKRLLYNKLITAGFILLGIHSLDYPFLRRVNWFAPYGFTICAVLTFSFALGMILKSKAEDYRLRKLNLEHIREIGTLYSVTSAVSRGKELSQILYAVLDNIMHALKLDAGLIFLKSKDGRNLLLKAHRGISEELARELVKIPPDGKSITKRAIEENRIIIISDIRKSKNVYSKDSLLADKIYGFVAVPLRSGTKILGALDVGIKRAYSFTSQDIRLLESIGKELGIAIDNKCLIEDLNKSYMSTILTLTDIIEAKDHYTRNHSDNVTRYAVETAKVLNLSDKEIEEIRLASQLHDLGKVSISDSILLKKGKLTAEEWVQMKKHPHRAVQILQPLMSLYKGTNILEYIEGHHERYDGQGYPNGYKGNQIKLGARILAVADAYDAMTSSRPYRKKPLSAKQAIKELKDNSGTQFDPKIVETFLEALKKEENKKDKY